MHVVFDTVDSIIFRKSSWQNELTNKDNYYKYTIKL